MALAPLMQSKPFPHGQLLYSGDVGAEAANEVSESGSVGTIPQKDKMWCRHAASRYHQAGNANATVMAAMMQQKSVEGERKKPAPFIIVKTAGFGSLFSDFLVEKSSSHPFVFWLFFWKNGRLTLSLKEDGFSAFCDQK